jgi:hypothetical protein
MINSGSTPERIREVQGMNSVESIQKALNQEAEASVDRLKIGDEFKNKVKEAGDSFLNSIKESIIAMGGTVKEETKVKPDTMSQIEDLRLQRSEIENELKAAQDIAFTKDLLIEDESVSKLEKQLNNITEALAQAERDLEENRKLAREGALTQGVLPQAPYLRTPGARAQAAQERANTQIQIQNETLFSRGLSSARGEIDYQIGTFEQRLGKSIPMDFRDGMVAAMKELANPNSTEPLKNRLLGVASAFLQKINEAFMNQIANRLTSGIMGGIGIGSTAPGMASGGYIRGGSGSKDDVPAMLMGGEYVIKKDAVKKYGASFFDALNNGSVKKFANGGWVESDITKYQDPASVNPYGQRRDQGLSFNENGQVIGMDSYTGTAENKQNALMRAQTDYYAKNTQTGEGGFYMPGQGGMGAIMGQGNLLAFATQQTAGTKFDKMSGMGNAASIDIGAGSSNLSLFALRDQNNLKNAEYLQSKQKSLDLYFGGIDAAKEKTNREEEIRKEQERIREEYKKREKEMYKSILTNLAVSVATAGIMAAGSAAAKGWSATNQASGGTATFGEKFKGAFTGGTMGGETRGGLFNAFSSSGYQDFSKIVDTQGNAYQWNSGNKNYSWTDYNSAFPKGANYSSSPTFKWGDQMMYAPTMRRAAGGYVAGNGMGDNVPAMLNGGEFVVSKQAAQNIGVNKLQQINSGNNTDSSEVIAAKLDELVEKLSAVGTLNITVNSDSNGKQQTQEQGGNQDKEAKELARRIKEVVMTVLKDEKRLGGMLR